MLHARYAGRRRTGKEPRNPARRQTRCCDGAARTRPGYIRSDLCVVSYWRCRPSSPPGVLLCFFVDTGTGYLNQMTRESTGEEGTAVAAAPRPSPTTTTAPRKAAGALCAGRDGDMTPRRRRRTEIWLNKTNLNTNMITNGALGNIPHGRNK